MGKGSRNSQNRLNDQSVFDSTDTKKKKKKNSSGKAVAIACSIFAILIVGVLLVNVFTETGILTRTTKAMELNDVKVDASMATFFYNDYIISFYNEYAGYLGYLNLSFSGSLKLQQFPAKGGIAGYILGEEYDGTWYEYFRDKVIENIEMYITLCDAANKAGIKLEKDDYDEVEEKVQNILDSVKTTNSSISDWFGTGVSEKDVRRCYEMIALATKYSEIKHEEIENGIKKDEESGKTPVADYVEKHKESFYSAEYLSYKIKVSGKNYSDIAYNKKVENAKKWAEKIANAGSIEAFLEVVKQYEIENDLAEKDDKKPSTETGTGTGTETEVETETVDIEKEAEKYKGTIGYETETGTGDSLENWIFIEGASEGDGKIFEETATETVKKTENTTEPKKDSDKTETGTENKDTNKTENKTKYNTYTVTAYLITKGSHLNTELTNNFAFVIGDNKADVEKFLKEFASSNATATKDKTVADLFAEQADKFYEKLHEGHDHSSSSSETQEPVFVYSSVEQSAKDFFKNNYFSKENDADKWIAGDLKDGTLSEVFTIEIEEKNSTTGKTEKKTYYVAVYFESRDREVYYVNGFNAVLSERFDDWYKNDSALKDIEYNQFALDHINTIVLY